MTVVLQVYASDARRARSSKGSQTKQTTFTLAFVDETCAYSSSMIAVGKSKLICDYFKDKDSASEAITLPCKKSSFEVIMRLAEKKCVRPSEPEEISSQVIADIYKLVVSDLMQYDDEVKGRIYDKMWKWMCPLSAFSSCTEESWDSTQINFNVLFSCFLKCHKLGLQICSGRVTILDNPFGRFINEINDEIEMINVKMDPEAVSIGSKANASQTNKLVWMIWMLRHINQVQSLDLSGSAIDIKVLRGFGMIQGIKKLKLNECTIEGAKGEGDRTAVDCESFGNLEECDISGMSMDEEIVSMLAKNKNLRKLGMKVCFVTSALSFEFIKGLTNLEELNISGNSLTQDQLDVVFRHKGLKVLSMERCTVNSEYVFGSNNGNGSSSNVDFMENVVEFSCGEACFGDDQLEMILMRGRFVKLSMVQCNLKTEMVMKMKGGDTLQDLNLGRNDMLENKILEHIGKECKKLERLNINGCNMVLEGKEDVPLVLKEVKDLCISGNSLGKEACERIFTFSSIESLDITGCGLVEGELVGIEKMEKLTKLNISKNSIGTEDLRHVFQIKQLEVLGMKGMDMFKEDHTNKGDVKLEGIKELSKLKTLDISDNILSAEHTQEIFKISQLEDLQIGYSTPTSSCINLENIEKLTNLRRLNLEGRRFEKSGFDSITKLERLEELNIKKCEILGDNVFEHVERLNNTLRVLEMNYNKLSIKDQSCLAKLKNLQEFNIESAWDMF